ncbi:carbohydrate ABC transporter permease [Agromyces albus]|uniref:Sugar ABC transporter permease n=1 Tax=Agromyces albus TaxID=205332 RepID=A0A4Q2KXA8_9MICO|nr:sugar ABC transporter permease [Agromyces albus]RXZ70274.1 sugar ABC transporter permease [Agromyces albus]
MALSPATSGLTSTDGASRATPRRSVRGRRWKSLPFYAFISPWLIGTILLTAFPLIYAFGVSLTNWDGISPRFRFLGLENYTAVFSSPETWSSLGRTFLLAGIVVPVTIVGGLLLAIALNQKVRFRTGFRLLVYLPAIIPPVAATLAWKILFDRDNGGFNAFLRLFGIPAVDWLSQGIVFWVLVALLLWGIGAGVLINLAALQDVPIELREAARLDGANSFGVFWHVTLPAISPVLLFQVITTTIAVLQTFIPVLLLSPATAASSVTAVPEENQVFMISVYAQYFAYQRYGYASAMLWIFFALILLLTFVFFKFSGRVVFYAVDPSAQEGRR